MARLVKQVSLPVERDEPLDPDAVERVAKWIVGAKRVVAFTGAGISTESGLADFRGPDGVWTRRDRGLPPPKSKRLEEVKPNRGHYALVKLQDLGKLDYLVSQNVDNLHRLSGADPERLAELHGNHSMVKCVECDARFEKSEVGWDDRRHGSGYRTSRPRKGQPTCPECGGRLISSVVNFGDPMPQRELSESLRQARQCDVMLVVGSSLVVHPAADVPLAAYRAGAKLAIVNRGETPMDHLAHVRVWGSAGEFLEALAARVETLLKS
ncbi:MAG: NAD-dependent protein deacetylase [Promethearchaeota archaeon]